jgi:hypothetical protein
LASDSTASPESERIATPNESRIPVGGAELYSREVGKGTAIIVLHGGPDFDHSYLLPDMDRLSDSYPEHTPRTIEMLRLPGARIDFFTGRASSPCDAGRRSEGEGLHAIPVGSSSAFRQGVEPVYQDGVVRMPGVENDH